MKLLVPVDANNKLDYPSVKDIAAIKEVTNQQTVYASLPPLTNEYSWRAKQSFNIKEGIEVSAILKGFGSKYKKISATAKEMDYYHSKPQYDKGYASILAYGQNNREYAKAIKELRDATAVFGCKAGNNLLDPYADISTLMEEELKIIGNIQE